jgi:hypothetical protein
LGDIFFKLIPPPPPPFSFISHNFLKIIYYLFTITGQSVPT